MDSDRAGGNERSQPVLPVADDHRLGLSARQRILFQRLHSVSDIPAAAVEIAITVVDTEHEW